MFTVEISKTNPTFSGSLTYIIILVQFSPGGDLGHGDGNSTKIINSTDIEI